MLYAIVALLVIILDQWTKLWVSSNGDLLPYQLIPKVISLVSAENAGGAFNFLAKYNVTIVFIVAAGLVTLLTIIALSTNLVKGGLGRWSLVFVSAGGLSNAIDRLLNQGKVQDMIKLDFLEKVGSKGINFPIFNIADIFITVFIFVFILYVLFGGRKKDDGEEDEDEDEEPEDEEDLEDDEEEDKPVRRKEKKQRRRKAADDEDEEEAKPQPRNYEENYERYKARKAREAAEAKPAPAAEPAPVVDPEDPFAEWERANQKVGKAAAARVAAPAPKPVEEPKPAPAPKPVEAPKPAPAPKPVEEPKPAPAPKPVEAPKPAPKAPAAAEPEEYNLDDILAEFR